jgi:hypothetical protein
MSHGAIETYRDTEEALLLRCSVVARMQGSAKALNQQEANLFWLASILIESRLPRESQCLLAASESYFSEHPHERLSTALILEAGWIQSLARFNAMLDHQLTRGLHAKSAS